MFSEKLSKLAEEHNISSKIIDLSQYEAEDKLPNEKNCCNAFLLSTYENGTPPPNAEWFCKWLEEVSTDFRVHKGLLSKVKYVVFGLGNSFYENNFNKVIGKICQ